MARTGKERALKATVKPIQKSQQTKASAHDKALKDQVLALGGTADDVNLVKGADDQLAKGKAAIEDPALAGEVSRFLKGLKAGDAVDEDDGAPAPAKSFKKDRKSQKHNAEEHAKAFARPDPKQKKGKELKIDAKGRDIKLDAKGKDQKPRKGKEPAKEPETPASTSAPAPVALPKKISVTGKFAIPPTSHWYSVLAPLDPSPSALAAPSASILSSLTTKAASLYTADVYAYQSSSSSNSASEAHFLSNIIHSGTLSDRLSALTLLVQSSPLHNAHALETLRGMAERGKGKGGRDESLKALRSIVDWWVGGGAPGRKLRYFRDQPLTHPDVTDEHLIIWHFEDWLKKYFFSILQILESLSLDSLTYVRMQALSLISSLLREKPEQEQNLLRLLVNKLGDPERTVCSRASYHTLQLLQQHPSMKAVVLREVVNLVMKPTAPAAVPSTSAGGGKHMRFDAPSGGGSSKASGAAKPAGASQNPHARYYATITLNQLVLTPGDRDVVHTLIGFYFDIFRELLGEKPEADDASDDKKDTEADAPEVDKRGRVKDKGKSRDKGKGKDKGAGKGKDKETPGAAGFAEVEDAQSKLISAILTGVNRALPFARLDSADAALNKHIDTLFLITHKSTFNISLQALVLIQQIAASLTAHAASTSTQRNTSTAQSIVDRYHRTLYASLHDARLATSSKQAMYLNLLFKSLKSDTSGVRIRAVVKRLVQVLAAGGNGATEFVAGGLYLLGQLFDTVPGLRKMITEPPPTNITEEYDPRKRDPIFAHASTSPLYELLPLTHHYHPAIALHAQQLLASQPLTAHADLSQNTLTHFLDRFVYKNPKKLRETDDATGTASGGGATLAVSGKARGASAMQPAASGVDGTSVKLMRGEVPGVAPLVTDSAFLKKREEDVAVDEVFFHRYLTRKQQQKGGKGGDVESDGEMDDEEEEGEELGDVAASGEDSDNDVDTGPFIDLSDDEQGDHANVQESGKAAEGEDEDDSDDEEEAEIWKAMKASMPKAGDDDDLDLMADSDEDDDVPSGLDADDSDDELPAGLDSDSDADVGLGSDEDAAVGADSDEDAIDSDEEDALSLAEASDDDDLMPLDDGFGPDGLIEYDGSDASDSEEWQGIGGEADKKKRKRADEDGGDKRKKKKRLPTFASYEDYAKMIEDGPEDDI
ncbi:CBF/Mak21 family-domain-containing protein [Schizophyllum amplum]|uniref:CBF/Mak21 family-domain-containing protein n=1 Tax=Schizophyllum amplum TaxID=97359 RepID=A0A550CPA0_9AGAR|nr:CBF/Mak21 family-domain-containing protein [Auriculariopsis ampla]